MRRIVLAVWLAVLPIAPALSASWATNSFRTASGDLVQRGDTMVEVRHAAGEPLDQRVTSWGIAIGHAAGLTREQWTYRGSDGIYVLTFAGDKVEQIKVVADR